MGNTLGKLHDVYSQTYPPKSKFSTHDIPDLSGKVMIVTGGTAGLGLETVKVLLQNNAKVYLAARSESKAKKAIDGLKNETGRDAVFLNLDLASLDSIERAAKEFNEKETRLDVLFNNGGVMLTPMGDLTADGYDLQFGTNVLGHYYFTKLVLPTLLRTAETLPDGTARVVNISSMAHLFGDLNFDSFRDSAARRKLSPDALYMQSKVGNIVFSYELAKRYGDQGIVSTAVHPGSIYTDILRHANPLKEKIMSIVFNFAPVSQGVLTQLWAGVSPETADFNGKYLVPWARVGKSNEVTHDQEVAQRLWTWLEDQVKHRHDDI
ncbi:NAD-binding protein [Rickenella mellea]|uniref:NAD-binding protein n=1 Tax=Rickenella mellea TaxID=50990 RepID=A0A4Y7QF59_9AGAM|nr:NAD-binding protein [Rickenella mellea]